MSIDTSTSTIEIGLVAVIATTAIIFWKIRSHFKHIEATNLTEKYKDWKWNSPIEARTKYPELDIFKLSGTLKIYGMLVALLLMIFAFSWTSYEKKVDVSGMFGTIDDEIEMETPRTAEPPPPPPPPPSVVQVVETDLPDVVTKLFEDQSINEETVIEPPVMVKREKEVVATPPPPPPPAEEEAEIFKVVEDAPTFPGCEEVVDKAERSKCAETKLLEFIYGKIQYPVIARENGVSGMVYIRFVVERDGSITGIEALRDVGGGCGDEAKRVVALMPKWNPGKQRGVPVRVMFTLPVKFELK